MTTRLRKMLAVATAATLLILFFNEAPSLGITQAQARIGRPATPGSVAGVARRSARRGAYVGAAVGAGAYYGHRYGYGRCWRNAYGHLVCP